MKAYNELVKYLQNHIHVIFPLIWCDNRGIPPLTLIKGGLLSLILCLYSGVAATLWGTVIIVSLFRDDRYTLGNLFMSLFMGGRYTLGNLFMHGWPLHFGEHLCLYSWVAATLWGTYLCMGGRYTLGNIYVFIHGWPLHFGELIYVFIHGWPLHFGELLLLCFYSGVHGRYTLYYFGKQY